MKAFSTRQNLLIIVLAGLAVRLAFVWMPGTEDMYSFRMWGALALRSGLVNVYTWKDTDTLTGAFMTLRGIPFRPRTVRPTDLGLATGVPDYPPGNILVLEVAVGVCKFFQGGTLREGRLLDACVNAPPVLFALGATLLLWWFVRRCRAPQPTLAVVALWLNPALILTSPVLGYQDPIFAFFGLLSLICFYLDRRTLGVLFVAISCLIKPQGVFLLPVLMAALWADGGWRMVLRYGARFLLFCLAPLLPFILTGRLLAPIAAIVRGAIFPALSAQTVNVWWLVGPVLQVITNLDVAPILGRIDMVPQSEFQALVGFDPLWVSFPAFLAFTAVNLYWFVVQLRAGNRRAIFWAAALEVYGYTMLALFVHENHLYAFFVYAAPLLALGHRFEWRIYIALSVVFGLNLYLFDGLGQGIQAFNEWPRCPAGFDLTVLLSVINVGVFLILLRTHRWGFGSTASGRAGTKG